MTLAHSLGHGVQCKNTCLWEPDKPFRASDESRQVSIAQSTNHNAARSRFLLAAKDQGPFFLQVT